MAKTINAYNIFIASPGDVKEEREIVRNICENLNKRPMYKKNNIQLNPQGWEDVMPQAGDPQEIINILVEKCDLLICFFHRYFGSLTRTHDSGTLEEFLNAFERWKECKKPEIMLYFKKVELKSIDDFNDPQLKKVMEFKALVQKERMALYKEFKDSIEFGKILENHLEDWLTCLPQPKPDPSPPPPPAAPPAIIPDLYRSYIEEQCCYMNIDALRKNTRALQLRLPEVYIPLYTSAPGKAHDKKKQTLEQEQQLVDIEELVGKQASLVIKGEAGCGKTTLIKHIAWSIIKGENRYGLNNHLPVLIYLRDFKRMLPTPLPEPCAGSAEKLLTLYLEQKDCGLTYPVVQSFCKAGLTLLLLDGLDEVEDKLRDCLVYSFAKYAERCPSLKIVFSGRPHGISALLLKHFKQYVSAVLPFNEEQIAQFVAHWWQEVHEGDTGTRQQQSARTLIHDLAANPDIADLKGNPLMLTAICFLYLDDNRLPDQRADLYARFVNRLLVNRFPEDHKRLFQFFMKLAHSMFTGGDKEIDAYNALLIFTPYYREVEGMDEVDTKIHRQERFEQVEANSGLMRRQNSGYSFVHLSIQEFLTAAFIKDNVEKDHTAAIASCLKEARYENVIRLYIGLLSVTENKGIANQIVENMLNLNADPETWLLAGSSLLDIHKDLRNDKTKALTVSKMEEIITARVAPVQLARAGELLGWLGDKRDLKVFVKIKGGQYKLEDLGMVQLKDFEIGKYPVTNSWYGEFLKEGGYADKAYWTDAGWDWRIENEVIEPVAWHERRWNCPNAPVVGISWYEAVAFTNWLTAKSHNGHIYRLPTEMEWQLAAGGKGQTAYPWGNEWDKAKCNTKELKLDKTTAVGVFMAGSTPVDEERAGEIMDLAGNVWEWTSSFYDMDNDFYTVRGGAWGDLSIFCRCAYRYYYDPRSRLFNLGFRCAVSNSQFKEV